jgi:hypothetical protein
MLTSLGARADGTVFLDYLRWDGAPLVTLRRPKEPSEFCRKAWVNNVSFFSKNFPSAFRISQDRGSGIIACGTREWSDYRVSSEVAVHLGSSAGLAARVQGLRRYYALQLEAGNKARLVKVRDESCTVLAEAPCRWTLEEPITLALEVRGAGITGFAGGATLHVTDDSDAPFENGGIGLVLAEGALSTDEICVRPLSEAAVRSESRPARPQA